MDNDTKRLLGKILGEIYRMQRSTDNVPCEADNAMIYGLLHGFENVINDVLEHIGSITSDQLDATMNVLDPFYEDPNTMKTLSGFYDIEKKLADLGVDRGDAIKIFKYLKANDQFTEVIDRMDTLHSPVECRNFDLSHWDI